MEINTLILSGGSIKGLSFLGTIKYLVENNYIDSDFKSHFMTVALPIKKNIAKKITLVMELMKY